MNQPWTVAGLTDLSTRLQADLTRLAETRTAAEAAWQQRRLHLAEAAKVGVQRLRLELEAIDPAAEAATAASTEKAVHERRLAGVAAAAVRLRRQAREDLERRLGDLRMAKESLARAGMAQTAGRRAEAQRAVATLRQRLQTTTGELGRQAGRIGATLPGAPVPAAASGADPDLSRATADLVRQLDQLDQVLARTVTSAGARICRWPGRIACHILAAAPAAAPFLWLAVGEAIFPALAILVVGQIAVAILVAWLRRRCADRLAFVHGVLADLAVRTTAVERQAQKKSADHMDLGSLISEGEQAEERQAQVRSGTERFLEGVRQRELRLRQRIERSAAPRIAAAQAQALAVATRRRDAAAAAVAEAEASFAAQQAEVEAAWVAERTRLAAEAAALVARVRETCAAATTARDAEHPPWEAPRWQAWTPATAWPTVAPLGDMRLRLDACAERCGAQGLGLPGEALSHPLALDLDEAAPLVIRSGQNHRAAALDLLGTLALRGLTACPPARLKLTLIDPVGLGQSFAPLLALVDQGEAVLPGGVAADDTRIERVLDDLCAHLEAVIRTRLRGAYHTVAAYNREAGDMQEPLRLVAIADFPSGFGERTLERLGVLLRSGARCGVHVLIHHDARQKLAPAVEAMLVQHGALVLRETGGALHPDLPALRDWTFAPAATADPAVATRLVAAVGAAAVQASRVEVPFAALVPPAGQEWSQSTADRLRIPVGLRGVGTLQYLELGRGTAQHVLIGGRTGSGKSTLLHILVTSAALWFHPRELEVHLIDFKKGVEFQAYAAHRLPHARVIAVESDREFGLSVLRRLDGELARRGELFRTVGAQDLAAHRRTGGEHLPRILLLIDEFQEFFTEDDVIARDAALLLDRFVRQGRAFGVHVVLGSQTLSGSYSLAKSSLGQMGVRIVLPCNESDAHLLLHEDNDGARLLTRPGEAIYNDQAGLAEGNSPFQVCWLGDEEHAVRLRAVAALATAAAWHPPVPTVVFAGDAPAVLDDEPQLAAMLGRAPAPTDIRTAAWIGQSSSLRGAAEVVLPAATGGNLLLAGQHREAAAATMAAIAIGLAARHPLGGLTLIGLDGEDADGPFGSAWTRLGASLPHGAQRFGVREAPAALAAAAGILDRRQSGEDAGRGPVVLAVFGLQRLRALHPSDDLGMDRPSGEPPADRFARLLAQGPEFGVHTVLWCDSLSALQRGLGRRSLRDLDHRILFQMSAADSTELIDDDGASRLGLHSALLAVLGDGTREKFRPYQTPGPAFIERTAAQLRARRG